MPAQQTESLDDQISEPARQAASLGSPLGHALAIWFVVTVGTTCAVGMAAMGVAALFNALDWWVPAAQPWLAICLWSAGILNGLFAGRRAYRWAWKERRRGMGQCPECRYDVRATPQRCPECGRESPLSHG